MRYAAADAASRVRSRCVTLPLLDCVGRSLTLSFACRLGVHGEMGRVDPLFHACVRACVTSSGEPNIASA